MSLPPGHKYLYDPRCSLSYLHHSTTHVHASACLMCLMLSCCLPCSCLLLSLSLPSPQTILCSSNFMRRHAAARFSGAHCSAGRVHWPSRQPAWQFGPQRAPWRQQITASQRHASPVAAPTTADAACAPDPGNFRRQACRRMGKLESARNATPGAL